MNALKEIPDFTRAHVNVADPRLGARATHATDEFFAAAERMLKPDDPVFIPGRYDANGKWMDGWETRRRRTGGHDHCVIRLGMPCRVRGFDLNTAHFTGNFAPAAMIEGCSSSDDIPGDGADWHVLIPARDLRGDSHNYAASFGHTAVTHLRVNIYPDGGIARLRVYGTPQVTLDASGGPVDLAAMAHGGRCVAWNDAHFGAPSNLLAPGRGVNMGDGWETRRRRTPGHDWVVIALGHPGEIEEVVVDTAHFKGNYPHQCGLQAAMVEGGTDGVLANRSMFWETLMPPQPLGPDQESRFSGDDLHPLGPVSHVRFNIIPDGGVSRLRLLGRPKR